MSLLVIVGSLAGLHAACYGAYKDSPYEKFLARRFVREIIFAAISSLIITSLFNTSRVNIGVLFLTFLGFSRIITELYKQFIREEPQKIYKIPSQVHILGKVPASRLKRLGLGFLVLLTIPIVYTFYNHIFTTLPFPFNGACAGLLTGILTALGGGYKDGFFEGFDGLIFLRSPVVGALSGLFLVYLSQSPFYVFFASWGLERMIVECYKGFIKPGYMPGKFKFKKVKYPKELKRRRLFISPYIVTWLIFIVLLCLPHKN